MGMSSRTGGLCTCPGVLALWIWCLRYGRFVQEIGGVKIQIAFTGSFPVLRNQ